MDGTYDIDSPIELVDSYFHAHGSRMSLQQWSSLPPASQELWEKLPDGFKAIILGSAKHTSDENVLIWSQIRSILLTDAHRDAVA
jgi:hypothetical protein